MLLQVWFYSDTSDCIAGRAHKIAELLHCSSLPGVFTLHHQINGMVHVIPSNLLGLKWYSKKMYWSHGDLLV